jgi:uncharacterized protein YjiS (DUF1127 family)
MVEKACFADKQLGALFIELPGCKPQSAALNRSVRMFNFLAGGFLTVAHTLTRTADRQWRPLCSRLLGTLRVWSQRNRQRHTLRLLVERDDYLLKDIGLSRDDALREANKPFWQR